MRMNNYFTMFSYPIPAEGLLRFPSIVAVDEKLSIEQILNPEVLALLEEIDSLKGTFTVRLEESREFAKPEEDPVYYELHIGIHVDPENPGESEDVIREIHRLVIKYIKGEDEQAPDESPLDARPHAEVPADPLGTMPLGTAPGSGAPL